MYPTSNNRISLTARFSISTTEGVSKCKALNLWEAISTNVLPRRAITTIIVLYTSRNIIVLKLSSLMASFLSSLSFRFSRDGDGIFIQLNRNLNESFHVCAEHAIIIMIITKIETKNIRYLNLYLQSARQAKQTDGWCEIWVLKRCLSISFVLWQNRSNVKKLRNYEDFYALLVCWQII